jgi:hypothetical protein
MQKLLLLRRNPPFRQMLQIAAMSRKQLERRTMKWLLNLPIGKNKHQNYLGNNEYKSIGILTQLEQL